MHSFTNPRSDVAEATKLGTVVHICGPTVWRRLRVALLTPTILLRFLNFLQNLCNHSYNKAYFKNKTESNAVTTHSDTKRNIPGGLSFATTLLHCTYSINKRVEQS